MPYLGKQPATISAVAVDTTTGTFSSNVTAGGTLAVTGETTLATHLNMGDGDIIKLGADADLQIQHNGTNSIIRDNGTGALDLQVSNFAIVNLVSDEFLARGTQDGAFELYNDGTKRIETTSSGVTVTGVVAATSLDISGDADIDGTLEADAMTLNGTAITTVATLSTGISNGNLPVFTSGVADDDFLRVNGTAIEGRSASEVLSDIGGQAALTFGISNTNIPIFTSGVADDDFLRVNGTSIEGRSASEVLSDIGASAVAGSSSIVTTGALDSGSITSGFGNINIGSSTITTTGAVGTGALTVGGAFTSQGIDDNADAVAITIDSSERVGISMTSPTAKLSLPAQASGDSGVARLAIESAVDSNDFTIAQYEDSTGTYTQIGQNVSLNSGGSTTVLDSGHRTASMFFDGRGNGALMFHTGGTNANAERMRIDSSGNVIIGETSQINSGNLNLATSASDAVLSMLCRSTTDTEHNKIIMQKSSTASGNFAATADDELLGSIIFRGVNTSAVSDIGCQIVAKQNGTDSSTVPTDLIINLAEVERLRLITNGRLENQSPTNSGNVLQDFRIDWRNENNAGIMAGIGVVRTADANAPGAFVIRTSTNVDSSSNSGDGEISEKFRVAANGDLTATDTSISSNSDSRLKDNISDFTYDLDKFKAFKTKTFDWKQPELHGDKSSVRGFVAQDIETVDAYWVDEVEIQKDSDDFQYLEDRDILYTENSIIPVYTVDDEEDGTIPNGKNVGDPIGAVGDLNYKARFAKTSKLGQKDAMYVSIIQQLITKIETLEAKVTTLEGE